MGVDAIEVAVYFGFEKLVFEGVFFGSEFGGEVFILLGLFMIIFSSEIVA